MKSKKVTRDLSHPREAQRARLREKKDIDDKPSTKKTTASEKIRNQDDLTHYNLESESLLAAPTSL